MPRTPFLEIANFICTFGDKLVLRDLFDQIIVPAFTSGLERETWGSTLFFLDVADKLLDGDNPKSRALVGRLVRQAELRREQIYDATTETLVADEKSLDTAPSSLFALLLDNHRLLFVREQADSPTLSQFGSTARKFIRSTHLNYINGEYETRRNQAQQRPTSKKALLNDIPVPDVEVVPIFSSESLETFVNRYKDLQVMRISLAETNNELDNTDFFRQLRESKKETKSQKTTVEHRNTKGLNKGAVVDQLRPALQGNAIIKLDGVDKSGDRLTGNNAHFNVRVPLSSIGRAPLTAAKMLYETFRNLVRTGVITLSEERSPPPQEKKKT